MSLPDTLKYIIDGTPAVSRASDPPHVQPGEDTVTVYIGPDTPPYEVTLHKNPLCAASKVFRRALTNPNFIEAQSNEMRFPEEKPDIFGAFCDWLYNKYPGMAFHNNKLVAETPGKWHKYWFEVFCLADRLMASGLHLYSWNQIKKIFNSNKPVKPSHEMQFAMFVDDTGNNRDLPTSAAAVQHYVVGHVMHWLPQCKGETFEDWHPFKPSDATILGADTMMRWERLKEVMDAMGRFAELGIKFKHPSAEEGFENKYGLDLVELEKEAREYDEKNEGDKTSDDSVGASTGSEEEEESKPWQIVIMREPGEPSPIQAIINHLLAGKE